MSSVGTAGTCLGTSASFAKKSAAIFGQNSPTRYQTSHQAITWMNEADPISDN